MADKVKVETEETKDLIEEAKFLGSLGSNAGQVDSGLEVLKRIYNRQLEQLIGMQVDEDFFNYMILSQPDSKEILEARMKNRAGIANKRKILSIIRNQMAQRIEWEKKNVK